MMTVVLVQAVGLLSLLTTALALRPGATVGIDLGTTNSAVAILRDGAPVIVPNARGELTTPSVVAFCAGGDVLVGADAVEQSAANARNTVHAVKRFIGRRFERVRNFSRVAGVHVQADAADGGAVFILPAVPQPIAPAALLWASGCPGPGLTAARLALLVCWWLAGWIATFYRGLDPLFALSRQEAAG